VICLGVKDVTAPRLGFLPAAQLSVGSRSFHAKLEVLSLYDDADVVIGTDLESTLGIAIVGLPVALPSPSPLPPDDVRESIEVSDPFPVSERQLLLEAIAPALSRNGSIDLRTSECNVPEALVRLDVKDDSQLFCRQYNTPMALRPLVDAQVQQWLDDGVTCLAPVNTPYNNPLLMARKKDLDGNWTKHRPCLDPRLVNKQIPDDRFPIPLVRDIFASLSSGSVFSTLDLSQAFHRFPILREHQPYTAFSWGGTQYMFKRAPFGLKNLTSMFQCVMARLLGHLPFVQVFVDDIVLFSADSASHTEHLCTVIDILTSANLILNVDKCHFAHATIKLLGFVVTSRGVAVDPHKLLNVGDWPMPTTGVQLMHYLGVANYLRDHFPLIHQVTAPLDSLRNVKDLTSVWSERHATHFKALQDLLLQLPPLFHVDESLPFYIATDASSSGIAAVLYQAHGEGSRLRRIIACQARTLHGGERNYSATKRELLAVIFSLQKFHCWVWGRPFTIFTDHRALIYLHSQAQLTPMLAGWLDVLLKHDFTIVHRPGILNVLPDHLSRLFPTALPGGDILSSDEQEKLSKAERYSWSVVKPAPSKPSPVVSDVPVLRSTVTDPISEAPATALICSIDPNYATTSIPDQPEERTRLLQLAHQLGHMGAKAMVYAVRDMGYTWPFIQQDAIKLAASCRECQRHNIAKRGFHPMRSIHASLPMDCVAIDLSGIHPTTDEGFHFMLIAVDVCTKFVFLVPLLDKTALSIAKALVNIFLTAGFPRILQSDNGTEFVNDVLKEILCVLKVDHRLSTPYHPQANGVAERTVQDSIRLVKKLLQGRKQDWARFASCAQYSLNTRITALHNTTPFTLFFGRKHNLLQDHSSVELELPSEELLLQRIDDLQSLVFPAVAQRAQQRRDDMAAKFNAKHKHQLVDYPPGSLVMATNLQRSKLDPKFEGPFKVIRRNKGGAYILQDLDNVVLTRNYAPSQLKLILSDDDELRIQTYEVERILGHKFQNGQPLFEVKWKGYDSCHNTFEPYSSFSDVSIVSQYWDTVSLTAKCGFKLGG
jgi:transposase InsO family protein